MANGFRPDTNQPGHHMTVLQTRPNTIGLPIDRLIVLDVLRRKRNLSDYTGEDIDDCSAEACRQEAGELLADVKGWLATNHPDLLD